MNSLVSGPLSSMDKLMPLLLRSRIKSSRLPVSVMLPFISTVFCSLIKKVSFAIVYKIKPRPETKKPPGPRSVTLHLKEFCPERGMLKTIICLKKLMLQLIWYCKYKTMF